VLRVWIYEETVQAILINERFYGQHVSSKLLCTEPWTQ